MSLTGASLVRAFAGATPIERHAEGDYPMQMKVPYLIARDGRLYYRRRVPEEHREFFGKREVKRSLGLSVGQEIEALPQVRALNKHVEERERAAERALRGLMDPHEIAREAWEWALEEKYVGHDTSGLGDGGRYEHSSYDAFTEELHDKTQRRKERMLREQLKGLSPEEADELMAVSLDDLSPLDRAKVETVKKGAMLTPPVTLEAAERVYVESKGGALDKVGAINIRQFKAWLSLPNVNPKYRDTGVLYLKDLSRKDAIKYTQYLRDARKVAPSTIKRRIGTLNALWTYALDYFDTPEVRNPWSRLKIETNTGATAPEELRLPFHKTHLDAIEKALETPKIDPEFNLMMRLLRCTGCRPGEIGGLHSSEVRQDDKHGVWIHIQPNDIRRIKTAASNRRIPVVDEEAARDLMALRDAKGEGPVFQRGFHNTSNLSQRALKFLHNKAGIPKSPRLVNYSWRHTVIEALRISGASESVVKAIGGHSGKSVSESYGAGGASLATMREALQAAMGSLGDVETYQYTEHELDMSGKGSA